MRRAAVASLAAAALLSTMGCIDLSARSHHGVAPGAEAITVRAGDNRPLDARLWRRDPSRLVLYLHEYRRSQRDWWEEAERGQPTDPSTMTLDLRGHGDSGGHDLDFGRMVDDVRRVIDDARGRGYQRVAVVGAGLGGTVGVLVARDDPAITVAGLSLPVDFGDLDALDAAPAVSGRLAIVASADDLSARESFERITRAIGIDGPRAVLLPGRAHGRQLLTGDSATSTRRVLDEIFKQAWRQ